MYDAILVRYGEIGLKAGNRRFFENTLINNLRRVLADYPQTEVASSAGRILVRTGERVEEVIPRINQVFGVVSCSPVIVTSPRWEAMMEACDRLLEAALHPGLTFKVEARRADKSFPLTSPQIMSQMGAHLLQEHPGLTVDVHDPGLKIEIEVRKGEVLVYGKSYPGPGGLPVASSGRGLLLLSGGLDSPVAGWMAMKRGIKLSAIYFHSFPYTGDRSREKVIELARRLAVYNQGELRLHVIHFTDIQETILQKCPERLRVTILRRMMLRIAEKVAAREKALALITGESVGQVASQTLESMSVIGQATSMLLLKPLAAMDKTEIMDLARQINTYDISILPYEDCCSLFVPRHPVTRPVLGQVEAAESGVDWEPLIEQAVKNRKIIQVIPGED